MEGRYSPVRPGVVATTVITPTIPARARRASVRLPAMPVHVRLWVSVAAWWRWSAVAAIFRVPTTCRWRVVVHRRSAARRTVSVVARVVIVAATRWWSAPTVVITTRAVATWWAAAVVVIVSWRWAAVATTAIAWRTGPEALTWAWDISLRLVRVSLPCVSVVVVYNLVYIRDAADGRVLERMVVELLNRSGEIGSRLVFDKPNIISKLSGYGMYGWHTLCPGRSGRGLC